MALNKYITLLHVYQYKRRWNSSFKSTERLLVSHTEMPTTKAITENTLILFWTVLTPQLTWQFFRWLMLCTLVNVHWCRNNYRPQLRCGKVMFSQVSVILFTGGGMHGGCAWQGAIHVGGTCMAGGCMAGVYVTGVGHMWWGAYMAGSMHDGGRGLCMAAEMATAVHGTHPIGMHSCFN